MTGRWYRWWRPELWLVLAIPAAALAGGIMTLRAVNLDLSADGATEGVRRMAQVQTAELDPDLAAARAHYTASLQIDRVRGEVRVQLAGGAAASPGLQLYFVHSLRADRDLQVPLQRRGGEWVAALAPGADARWRVALADSSRRWRLVGTLPRGGANIQLQPALSLP
ncbi:MAG: FixH family protein [Arenimonas sp.]